MQVRKREVPRNHIQRIRQMDTRRVIFRLSNLRAQNRHNWWWVATVAMVTIAITIINQLILLT